jgi:hypothetical protein
VVGDFLNAGLGENSGMQAEVWVHRNDVEKARAVLEHRDPSQAGKKEQS